jgi:hypothetical protein
MSILRTRIAEVRTRVKMVFDYLAAFKPEDFVGCEDRACSHTWMGDKSLCACPLALQARATHRDDDVCYRPSSEFVNGNAFDLRSSSELLTQRPEPTLLRIQ